MAGSSPSGRVRWDPERGAFVPVDAPAPAPAPPAAPPPATPPAAGSGGGRRHVVIGPEAEAAAPRGSASARSAPPAARPAPPPPSGRPAPPPARPAPRPGTAPQAPRPPRPPGANARLAKRLLAGALAFVVFVVVGLFAFGWWQFSRIPRVDVAAVLSKPTAGGTNYLIVGTDSREGIKADDPNASAFLGPGAPGGDSIRTDTIMVMRVEKERTMLLSIPRDLYVKNPKTGEMGRINAVYQSGPAQLIRAVQDLGIPVQHYLEINFVSFARLVDAVGGIDVTFEHPTRDENSGLYVDTPGVNHLDGEQGLAYVRSRHFEEQIDGKYREDPTADLGRVKRQQVFLKSLMSKIGNTKNPVTVASVSSTLGEGLKIDNTLTFFDALALGWRLRSFNPEPRGLPTQGFTTSGGAAVLRLTPDAKGVIGEFAT